MTQVPRVSIVVAAYNVAPYLRRCMESLLGQSEESFEVILVNDGSTDETPALVNWYASIDHRVKGIHCSNGGVSAARNIGLRASKAEFVCFVDGDDWIESDMVQSMSHWCASTGASVAFAGVYVDFHDQDEVLIRSERRVLPSYVIRRGVPLEPHVSDDNFVNLLGYVWNKMYRREWLAGLGLQFEEGLSLFEDIDFNSKVLSAADQVVLVPDAFVHYVQRPRKSLGTTHDESFLSARLFAIKNLRALLKTWGVPDRSLKVRTASASAMALWLALNSVAQQPLPKVQLQKMLNQRGVDELIAYAKEGYVGGWRGLWATGTLSRNWYGMALLPMRSIQLLRSIRAIRKADSSFFRVKSLSRIISKVAGYTRSLGIRNR